MNLKLLGGMGIPLILLLSTSMCSCIGFFGYGNTNIQSIKVFNRGSHPILATVEIDGDDNIHLSARLEGNTSQNLKEKSSHQPGVDIMVRWYDSRTTNINGPSQRLDPKLSSSSKSIDLGSGDYHVEIYILMNGTIKIRS